MSDSVRPHRRQPARLPRPWDSPGKNTGVGCHFLLQCMKVKSESEVVQSCPTLSDPTDCSPPGTSVHGIFQARVLEWVPLPSPPVHTTMFTMNDQQGPTGRHMQLCSMLCGRLDGRGVWGWMATCICMTESLCCPPETTTTLLIGCTPKQNKKFKNFLKRADYNLPFMVWLSSVYKNKQVNWCVKGVKAIIDMFSLGVRLTWIWIPDMFLFII